MALLAGDGLQALAFETALNPKNFEKIGYRNGLLAVYELACASGITGMVGGQVLDLEAVCLEHLADCDHIRMDLAP